MDFELTHILMFSLSLPLGPLNEPCQYKVGLQMGFHHCHSEQDNHGRSILAVNPSFVLVQLELRWWPAVFRPHSRRKSFRMDSFFGEFQSISFRFLLEKEKVGDEEKINWIASTPGQPWAESDTKLYRHRDTQARGQVVTVTVAHRPTVMRLSSTLNCAPIKLLTKRKNWGYVLDLPTLNNYCASPYRCILSGSELCFPTTSTTQRWP